MSKNIRQQGMPNAGSPLFMRACHEVMDEALGRKGNLLNQFVTLIQAIKMGLILVDAGGNIVNRNPVVQTSRELNSVQSVTVATADLPYEMFRTHKMTVKGGRNVFVVMLAYTTWTFTNVYPTIIRCEDDKVVADGSEDPDAGTFTYWYTPTGQDRNPLIIAGIDTKVGSGSWSYKLMINADTGGSIDTGLRRAFASEYEVSQFSFTVA